MTSQALFESAPLAAILCITFYSPIVAAVICVWPSSVRSTSSIVSFPHLGQTMSFPKVGRIPLSSIPIWPTSQSNSCRHFLHSKLIVIVLVPFFPSANDGGNAVAAV